MELRLTTNHAGVRIGKHACGRNPDPQVGIEREATVFAQPHAEGGNQICFDPAGPWVAARHRMNDSIVIFVLLQGTALQPEKLGGRDMLFDRNVSEG